MEYNQHQPALSTSLTWLYPNHKSTRRPQVNPKAIFEMCLAPRALQPFARSRTSLRLRDQSEHTGSLKMWLERFTCQLRGLGFRTRSMIDAGNHTGSSDIPKLARVARARRIDGISKSRKQVAHGDRLWGWSLGGSTVNPIPKTTKPPSRYFRVQGLGIGA